MARSPSVLCCLALPARCHSSCWFKVPRNDSHRSSGIKRAKTAAPIFFTLSINEQLVTPHCHHHQHHEVDATIHSSSQQSTVSWGKQGQKNSCFVHVLQTIFCLGSAKLTHNECPHLPQLTVHRLGGQIGRCRHTPQIAEHAAVEKSSPSGRSSVG